jgi:aminoglycoside phosphotransferase (APT) family kinase protein
MHAGEAHIDVALVRRLLTVQLPRWADMPIDPVDSAGTDNALYRLGDDMVVRLPRIRSAISQVGRDHEWLPRLAPQLPLDIPVPLALGAPAEDYPWPWAVHRWLHGEVAEMDRLADRRRAAIALGEFVAALQRIDPAAAPDWAYDASRGRPLATRDAAARSAIAELDGAFDTGELTAAWKEALRAPAWEGPPVWFHGDLHTTNLLACDGRLSAVIDFGCLGVGDPACDLMPAWIYLSADTRDAFRSALTVDDASWARGRGWALSVGLIALPYYETTNPVFAGIARHAIEQALADRHG